ncbi:MAG: aminotransferase class V-fold PLP-dependent enzyme, partial [Myxococcales bacterium]|nr:aminotransferase class V-fold PLP-dependent enzyme [Myxococcales bacterium]
MLNPPLNPIYLDHAATTPLRPEVLEAMRPYWGERFGNPSSVHRRGQKARAAVEGARRVLAELLGAPPSAVVFTGSGTEANNLALRGVSDRDPDRRILVTGTEHDSVTATVAVLAKRGRDVRAIGVDRSGAPDLAAMETAAAERPALISLSLVNSETGRVAPLGAVAEIAGRTGALLHVDAVQALGKLPPEVIRAIPADLVTVSGHKIEGPKGVGVLAIKTDASIEPQISGGGQEFGLRSGTENVPAIVGFARA